METIQIALEKTFKCKCDACRTVFSTLIYKDIICPVCARRYEWREKGWYCDRWLQPLENFDTILSRVTAYEFLSVISQPQQFNQVLEKV